MNRYHYEYRLIDFAEDEREWIEFDCWEPPGSPLDRIAEIAADHYWADGGSERQWPLTFDVREARKPKRCGRYEILCVPQFIAVKIQDEKQID